MKAPRFDVFYPGKPGDNLAWLSSNAQPATEVAGIMPGDFAGHGGAENFPAYTGPALEVALRDRLAGVSGIWLVAGTGVLGHYPPPDVIDQALSNDWKLVDAQDFNPLQVKHYERRQG